MKEAEREEDQTDPGTKATEEGARDTGHSVDSEIRDGASDGSPVGEARGFPEDPVAELRAEHAELNDRHLRLAAEFNNFRRRAETEALGTWSRAQADLIERFLEVLDDLQRVSALDPADEKVTVQSIVEGIDLVERKFVRVLDDAGTETIEPAEGDAFDPEQMEAMMRVPTDDASRDDAVAQLFQKGYSVDGTLVRAARVSVYKAD